MITRSFTFEPDKKKTYSKFYTCSFGTYVNGVDFYVPETTGIYGYEIHDDKGELSTAQYGFLTPNDPDLIKGYQTDCACLMLWG